MNKAKKNRVVSQGDEPLAIVGIGCRFPGGVIDTSSYWDLVINAKDGIVRVPADRWDADSHYDPDPNKPGKMYVRHGGFLQQKLDRFDAMFFGISPREAERMDPQQRLLLETSWEALEDAGIPAESLAGSNTGVYIGAFTFDNQLTQTSSESRHLISAQTATSSTFTMLSNRLSYFYDFRGPSVSMDTACSSSLVAFHHACQAIWNGTCDLVLTGGANAIFRPEAVVSMCKGGFLSPDGRSKSFDSRANGYGRGEGSGIVVVKPLAAALEANDRIYCVIRGTGVNQDGRTNGITVPNPEAQKTLAQSVCESAGINPISVQYIEAHGTGTPVGDPLEANSLGTVYGQNRPDGKTVAIGSVKANIGHTEAAAGIAGVIKACLSLHHDTIPPLANLQEQNPNIPFADLGLHLPTEPEPMSHEQGSPRAAINSFGYGGTNAHAILEQYQSSASRTQAAPDVWSSVLEKEVLFPLSARSTDALNAAAQAIVDELPKLAESHTLQDICYNAAARRSHHGHRLIVRCNSFEDLRAKLGAFLGDGQADGVITGKLDASPSEKPVFVFTGMGPQWWGMGRELMLENEIFRHAVEECDVILQRIAGWSIIEELAKDEEHSCVTETQIAQPANFVVQYGLTKVLAARGITPAAIVGHSVGEVTAACVSGVLNLEDAITVSYHRSRIQKKTAGQGGMLAVGIPLSDALELLRGRENGASVAAVNSPNAVTLAGDVPVLTEIAAELEAREIFNRKLEVEVPYHSHYMEPLKPETLESLSGINPSLPDLPLYSTVTGEEVKEVLYDAGYWCDNIREPVYFAKVIENMLADGHKLFVEIGPHPVLSTSLRECIVESGSVAGTAATLRRNKPETDTLVDGICTMYCNGLNLNWDELLPESVDFVQLPLYKFQRESLWFESPTLTLTRFGPGKNGHPLLLRRTASAKPTWESPLSPSKLPYVPDHVVDGVVVFPGAGYIEAVLTMHHRLTEADASVLTDIEFFRALVIDGEDDPLMMVSYDEQSQKFAVHSRTNQDEYQWTAHASGLVSAVAPGSVDKIDLAAARVRCDQEIDIDDIYAQLDNRGLTYGEHFRRMVKLSRGDNESLARIEPHSEPGSHFDNYRLHPTLLDGCFQSLIGLLDPALGGADVTFVPVGIDKMILRKVPKGGFWCVGELVEATATTINGHLTLVDDDGEVIAQVRGFRCQALAQAQQSATAMLSQIAYEVDWELIDSEPMTKNEGSWIVFADNTGCAAQLLAALADFDHLKPLLVTNGSEFSVINEAKLVVPFDDSEKLLRLVEHIDTQEENVAGVVWLNGLDSSVNGSSDQLDVEGLDAVDCFATFVKTLNDAERSWPVIGVTRNASNVLVGHDSVDGIAQAPFAGLLKVALNEYPELQIKAVDLDGTEQSISALVTEMLSDSQEDHIALRSGDRYVQRIVRSPVKVRDAELGDEELTTINADQPFALEQLSVGSIDSLTLRQSERRDPDAGEIEVRLIATSLNFKDIAKAMNIMSDAALEGTFHQDGLGLEASGRVVKVGDGVTEYAVGDSVILSVKGCFRSYATLKVDPSKLFPITERYDLVETAGVPTVFMTSHHALVDLAQLQQGEKVLIHAGAGGVGLAAIQIAQWIGAEIFSTAGSEEKREYLRSLGVQHVMDSRSLDFAEQINDITAGKGVDVVLNSLPTEYIHKSLEALAPFGRFVEIGKKDLVIGTNISLQPFNKVLSFSTLDFDVMVAQRPDLAARVIGDVRRLFDEGILAPIRTQIFPPSELREAFKYMARSQHIGKVVIDWNAEETVEALPRENESSVFKSDARYLISGGCGGFGLSMADWLVERGVRYLALMGRSGAKSDEAKSAIDAMRAKGANVSVQCVDVTDNAQVAKMIEELSADEVPLAGIFHAAAVLDDDTIAELDRDRYSKVMRPKIVGARNLDECTQGIALDMFVLFSSVASVIGNARQANYVAANQWFDAFAAYRRARGLAATSVNWGPIADVGMAARNDSLAKILAASGFTATTVDNGMVALEHALRWQPTQLGLFDIDWSTWASVEPTSGAAPRFASLVASGGSDLEDHPLYKELAELAEEERAEVLNYVLIEQIADTLRISAEKLEASNSIGDLGMDSLMAAELQTVIRLNMGVDLSFLEMMKAENIGQMGSVIMAKMKLGSAEDTGHSSTNTNADVDDSSVVRIEGEDVEEMTDAQIDKLLEGAEIDELLEETEIDELLEMAIE